MRKLILTGALVAAGCGQAHPTVPNSISTMAGVSVSAPSFVTAQQAVGQRTGCSATVGVFVAAGNVDLFLTNIVSRFVDQSGIEMPPMPPVTQPAPVPTAQFGSTLVAARSSRTFPVVVGFGCGTGRTGTITLLVQLTDANGTAFGRNLNVHVN